MQPSQSSSEPRVLRCPHCGAPLDAPPFALTTRCGYCGHNVELAQPGAPRPMQPPIPPAGDAERASSSALPLVIAGVVVAVSLAAVVGHVATRATARPATTPKASAAVAPLDAAAPQPAPAAPAPDQPRDVRYPLRSLLAIDTTLDIDASSAHLLGVFPAASSTRIAGQLRFVVPLSHPWFGAAELAWKNERKGKLTTVGFKPPQGDTKLRNQKEIADCLTKSLGKPEVREIDHLAGELSYFWGRHFPTAWANVYSGYLWLSFEDPKGRGPVKFPQVVRTLESCTPQTP